MQVSMVQVDGRWDGWLQELPSAHALQSSGWAEFKAGYGWQPQALRLHEGGRSRELPDREGGHRLGLLRRPDRLFALDLVEVVGGDTGFLAAAVPVAVLLDRIGCFAAAADWVTSRSSVSSSTS